ncbi:urease accessory protein UreD, partial [Streptomyces sp. NPDC059853]|uniref:urease accessory protein UreD n=1 Tax=Streptomyces sp. NPDC059853 TaxID=3346973 RepID=UPI003651E508
MTVTARAAITAAPGGRLPVLAGEGPLALRRTRAPEPGWAQVTTVGAMSAPLGGDRLRLTVTVLPGAALRVTSAAATVALPGRDGTEARYDTVLTVGEGGILHWLPEPVISAAGSRLRTTTRIDLAAGARLVLREQLVLGRADEPAGRLTTRLTVRRAGRPLLDQELDIGPGAPGWDGGAVLGDHRA